MARGKMKADIFQEIKQTLKEKEHFGESKSAAKQDGSYLKNIYSYNTAKVYNRECQRFGEYVKEHGAKGRHTPLNECFQLAREYISNLNNNPSISAYTVKMRRAALAKLYGVSGQKIGKVKQRHRADVTRSRNREIISEKTGNIIKNPTSRAGHFSEKNHKTEVLFAKATGMRRSEMSSVRGNQIICVDGQYYFKMDGYQCKGGRPRTIPIKDNIELIKNLCARAGKEKIFKELPKNMDVHFYRGVYATQLYYTLARRTEDIPKEDRYICRKDLKGVIYDKEAMMIVSEALGHSRISVIAEHYLRAT